MGRAGTVPAKQSAGRGARPGVGVKSARWDDFASFESRRPSLTSTCSLQIRFESLVIIMLLDASVDEPRPGLASQRRFPPNIRARAAYNK